jgi:hypothetical protein
MLEVAMQFHADGRKVFKSAKQTKREDGSEAFSLGFPILEVCDYVKNGDEIAKAVAEVLSASPLFD